MNLEPKSVGIIQFTTMTGPRDKDEGEEAQAQWDGQILNISATSWHQEKRKLLCDEG